MAGLMESPAVWVTAMDTAASEARGMVGATEVVTTCATAWEGVAWCCRMACGAACIWGCTAFNNVAAGERKTDKQSHNPPGYYKHNLCVKSRLIGTLDENEQKRRKHRYIYI